MTLEEELKDLEKKTLEKADAIRKKYFTKENKLHPKYMKRPEYWEKQYEKEIDSLFESAERTEQKIRKKYAQPQEASAKPITSKPTAPEKPAAAPPELQPSEEAPPEKEEGSSSPTPSEPQKKERRKDRMATLEDIEAIQDSILAALEDYKKTLDEILDRLDIIASTPAPSPPATGRELFTGTAVVTCPVCGQEQEVEVRAGKWKCKVCGHVGTYIP